MVAFLISSGETAGAAGTAATGATGAAALARASVLGARVFSYAAQSPSRAAVSSSFGLAGQSGLAQDGPLLDLVVSSNP